MGLIAIVLMSTVAIYQNDVKRLLAYSSIAQIGYMIIGVSMLSVNGLTATTIHLFNHALMKAVLFLALAAIFYRINSVNIKDMAGLGKAMPFSMAAFLIGGLSLIGVPLTVGFVSKWYLILAALENGWWPVAILILFSSLLAVIYIWKIIEVTYLTTRPKEAPEVTEVSLQMLIPIWALVCANIYFGIDTDLTVSVAESIAQALIGEKP